MKIQVTLDAAKLRTLVKSRSYKNKEGEEVTVQEVKFELVPMKEDNWKVIHEADKYKLVKTHFAAAVQTKEEREAKAPTLYIGEGFVTIWKNESSDPEPVNEATPVQDELPF